MDVSFLSDPEGKTSSMRVMSFLALLIASGLSLVKYIGWGSGTQETEIIFYFLVAAFAPKAVQRFAETEDKKKKKAEAQ